MFQFSEAPMARLFAILVALFLMAAPASAQTAAATTNGSVSITTGNTFQTVLAAVSLSNPRRSLTIENNNTNGDNCWVHVDTSSPTKANSILIGQGGSYSRYYPYVPADAIQATCATTADTLYVDTQ